MKKKSKFNEKSKSKTNGKGAAEEAPGFKTTKSKGKSLENKCYGGNDVSWYKNNAALTESAAKIPFALQPGREVDMKSPFHYGQEPKEGSFKYPGIMAFDTALCVGLSEDIHSPINISAREIYGKIRSKYSGSLEADAPDIMMYVLAVDSLYALYEDMKRAYYCVNLYSPYNTLYPKSIIAALGYDFDDLLANKTLLYQRIVEAGAMLSKYMVPNIMDLTKRHSFMAANIYADSPNVKSQQYVFKLNDYYVIANADTMTKLESVERAEQYLKVDDVWNEFYSAITALMEWDTAYTIVGYLERAYEGETFLVPSPVILDGVLSPVYNEEILLQIHNATVLPIKAGTLDITQDPTNKNVLLCKPEFKSSNEGSVGYTAALPQAVLSVDTSAIPSADEIIIATRLTSVGDPISRKYISCGTEILTAIRVYVNVNGAPETVPTASAMLVRWNEGAMADPNSAYNRLKGIVKYSSLLSMFDRHPHFVVYMNMIADDNSFEERADGPYLFTSMDDVTIVDYDTVANLHRMCIYSEFNCF